MKSERLLTYIGFFIISTVWGSTWLAIKLGLESMPPFFAAGIRFVVAAAVLFLILRLRGVEVPWTLDARKTYLALGMFAFSIPFALVYWGQQFIASGLSSILFGAYPFWVALFSHFLLKEERLDLFKIGGISIGFVGIVVIFWGDMHLADTKGLLGMSAMVASTVLQAYSLIAVKKYGQAISPFAMNFVGMVMGAVCLLALSLSVESLDGIRWDATAIGSILYLAVIGSVLTFVSYYWLLKRIEAVYLSLTSFINPVVAVVLGGMVLGETLAPTVLVGAVLVLAGILIANGKEGYGKKRVLA